MTEENHTNEEVYQFEIHNKIPSGFRDHTQQRDMPVDLIGAEILKFGSVGTKFEGGGLGIEYKTKEGEIKSIIFEFNEEGMWISYTS